jgi:hypothetical protein
MPIHRGLTLKKFIHAIPPHLFERYLDQLQTEGKPSGWALLHHKTLAAFLDDPQNAGVSPVILEDFHRINDLCGHGMSLLVRAYRRAGLDIDQSRAAEELAMRLFLDHREAFECAWSLYLIYSNPSKLSVYRVPGPPIDVAAEHVERLQNELASWFSGLAKGDACQVDWFVDGDETVIRISRGSYLRTVACWQGHQVTFVRFRPASEDVIVYNRRLSELLVKASLPKDRAQYLTAFAACIAGDARLAEAAREAPVFTLAPLQDGTFHFEGDGVVTGVSLVRVTVNLRDRCGTVMELKSDNIVETLRRPPFAGLPLAAVELVAASFRFQLQPEDVPAASVTFEIEPPARTNLTQKPYADIIERYLREQGVRLL